MKITNFNRENLNSIRSEFEKELKVIGNKFGISFNVNTIRFTEKSMHCKLEGNLSDNCSNESFLAIEFKEKCHKYGLKPTDLRRKFTSNDKTFRIIGLKVRNRKYPIIAENVLTGKSYKFSIHQIKDMVDIMKG